MGALCARPHAAGSAALGSNRRADPFFGAGLFDSVSVWRTRQVVPEAHAGALRAEIEAQRARV